MDNFYSTSFLDDDLLDEIPLRFEGLDDFFRAADRDSGDTGLLLGTYLPSSSLISTPDTGAFLTELLLSPTLTGDGGSPFTVTPMPSTPPAGGNMIENTVYDGGKIHDFQLHHEPHVCTPHRDTVPAIILTPDTQTLPVESQSFFQIDIPHLYAPLPQQTLSDLILSPLSLLSLSPSASTSSSLSPWSSPLSLPPSPLIVMGASHESDFVDLSSPFKKQIPSPVQRRRQRSMDDEYIPAISSFKRSRIAPAHENNPAKADHPTRKSDSNNNEHHDSAGHQQIRRRQRQRRSAPRHLNDLAPSDSGSRSSSSMSIGHPSDGLPRCEKCNRSFSRESDYGRHILQTKCSNDPIKCVCKFPHCGRVFCRYDAAVRHSRFEHAGEEGPFEFVHKSELLRLSRTGAKKKPGRK